MADKERELGGLVWGLCKSIIPIFIIDLKRRFNVVASSNQTKENWGEKKSYSSACRAIGRPRKRHIIRSNITKDLGSNLVETKIIIVSIPKCSLP
jgi:hypothetical protein